MLSLVKRSVAEFHHRFIGGSLFISLGRVSLVTQSLGALEVRSRAHFRIQKFKRGYVDV
jgi:hypothetical protein